MAWFFSWLLVPLESQIKLFAATAESHPSNIHHIVMVESLQGPLFSFPSFFFFQSFFVPSSMQLRYSLYATVSHLLITDSHCRYLLSRQGKIPIPIMTLGVGEAQDKEGVMGLLAGEPV